MNWHHASTKESDKAIVRGPRNNQTYFIYNMVSTCKFYQTHLLSNPYDNVISDYKYWHKYFWWKEETNSKKNI